jgi:hypothetical protein
VVPPIVEPVDHEFHLQRRRHILLNLGGLNNPFWSVQDTLAYARLVVEPIARWAKSRRAKLVIATNATVAKELSKFGACNYTREEMQHVLARARYAFMTPGLGNIFDAARFGTRTIWLPPANDSQGQQKNLLVAHAMADGWFDWHDVVPGARINYRGDQEEVLRQITQCIAAVKEHKDCQKALERAIVRQSDFALRQSEGLCRKLIHRFGSGGAERVAELVYQEARR